MTQYLILCRSLTYAQRSARLLERAGIAAFVTKAPQGLSPRGCGYALSLRRRIDQAAALLRQNGLLHGSIFQKTAAGEYIEVDL